MDNGISEKIFPPHVCAIRQLETLHNQKLWQSGKQKQYYTGITDILRRYIGDRYRVKAMELTSQEILDEMERQRLSGEAADRLKNILLTADFVKFAKFVADAERNEEVYSDAYYFVEQTKETEVEHTPAELELEVFVHGAMCVAYSGRCLLSSYYTSRSANEGRCTQPCRWKYRVAEEKRPEDILRAEQDESGSYLFSSRDLCMQKMSGRSV